MHASAPSFAPVSHGARSIRPEAKWGSVMDANDEENFVIERVDFCRYRICGAGIGASTQAAAADQRDRYARLRRRHHRDVNQLDHGGRDRSDRPRKRAGNPVARAGYPGHEFVWRRKCRPRYVDMRGFGAAAANNTLFLVNGRRVDDLDLSASTLPRFPAKASSGSKSPAAIAASSSMATARSAASSISSRKTVLD